MAIERDKVAALAVRAPFGGVAGRQCRPIASKAVGVIGIVTIVAIMGASLASAASYWRFGQFARMATKVSVIEVRRSCLHAD
jgi:hypothetical protein